MQDRLLQERCRVRQERRTNERTNEGGISVTKTGLPKVAKPKLSKLNIASSEDLRTRRRPSRLLRCAARRTPPPRTNVSPAPRGSRSAWRRGAGGRHRWRAGRPPRAARRPCARRGRRRGRRRARDCGAWPGSGSGSGSGSVRVRVWVRAWPAATAVRVRVWVRAWAWGSGLRARVKVRARARVRRAE